MQKLHAIIRLQANYRMHQACNEYQVMLRAVETIQRSFYAHKRLKLRNNVAATKIQGRFRVMKARKQFVPMVIHYRRTLVLYLAKKLSEVT